MRASVETKAIYILLHRGYSVSIRRVLGFAQMISASFQLALLIAIVVLCFSLLCECVCV